MGRCWVPSEAAMMRPIKPLRLGAAASELLLLLLTLLLLLPMFD
jgi:hypothetical protein